MWVLCKRYPFVVIGKSRIWGRGIQLPACSASRHFVQFLCSMSVHMLLPHPSRFCPHSGDDDEYVNPTAIVRYIKEHGSSPLTLHGRLRPHSDVMRSTKYAISEALYPYDTYPSFLSGGGFLFPGASVKRLHEVAQKIPVFPLDDVYFGFLALAANLTYRHDGHFYVWGLAFNACKYREALVVHGIGPERLVTVWAEVQKAQCQGGQGGQVGQESHLPTNYD
uniref:Hexosyltransferase n=1 Tax=Xenopus tropicalis TaxID=8364 RepID=A0A1B8XXV0_XENTR